MSQKPASRIVAGIASADARRGAAHQQRPERFRRRPPNHVVRGVSGNGLRSLVPEHYLAVLAKQGCSFRKTVQCRFKQFGTIAHPDPSMSSIGGARINLIAIQF
jgi:hypothetical protein